MDLPLNTIIQGDILEVLKTFPDDCIDTIITSPPYWGLRNYGIDGQLGLEKTFAEYLEKLLLITAELKRVLKKSGSLFWNHGDSYGGIKVGKTDKKVSDYIKENQVGIEKRWPEMNKCLIGQPWRLAIKMCDEQGWILRSDIKWVKQILLWKEKRTMGSVMPTSVKDRFNNAGEYLFHFVKNQKYYFDLDAVRIKPQTFENRPDGFTRSREYGYQSKFLSDYSPQNKQSGQRKSLEARMEYTVNKDTKQSRAANIKKLLSEVRLGLKPNIGMEKLKVKDKGLVEIKNLHGEYEEQGRRIQLGLRKMGKLQVADLRDEHGTIHWSANGEEHPSKNPRWNPALKQNKVNDPRGNHEGGPGSWRDFKDENENSSNPNGKNIPNTWLIGPEPSKEYHFAQFPTALCEIPILSTVPEKVCKECGKPREKIERYLEKPNSTGKGKEQWLKDRETGRLGTMGGTSSSRPSRSVYSTPKEIIGHKDCGCNAGFESGVILDPFMGSGTVAVVAERLRRKWVGIELNPAYIKIAQSRLAQQVMI